MSEKPVFFPCPQKCEPEAPHRTPHLFLEERGDYNERYLVCCFNCKTEHEVERKNWLFYSAGNADPKPSKAYLTKYPRIEPHTGEVVKSKDHEKETVKRMGYYEAPHGINRDYD